MKRMSLVVVVFVILVGAAPAAAEPTVNIVWDVLGPLPLGGGTNIVSLDMDVEIGAFWLAGHGGLVLSDSTVLLADGSGFINDAGGVSFTFLTGDLILDLFLNDLLNGEVDVFDAGGTFLGTAVIVLNGIF